MSISLTDRLHTPAEVARIAENLMQCPVKAGPIGQGANSRVYRLDTSRGNYVLKFYFQHPLDPRNRLDTEFKSLTFLWEQGIRQVPQPLNAWPQESCALYALVQGVSPGGQVKEEDIDQAVGFLGTLKGLSKSDASRQFGPASEAFFCAKDIVGSLRARLKRFRFEDSGEEYTALQGYLQDEYMPLLETVEAWSKKYLAGQGLLWEQEISEQYRTLSPSDFGFHNALRTPEGKIIFLDFEYFGWDDPAKTVSDFLWHPAMSLTEDLKHGFTGQAQKIFSDDPYFQARVKAFFPVFGLKWCLIFLNEFVGVDMQRRGFAGMIAEDKTAVRLRQLARARALSNQIRFMYKDFPYGN